VVRPISLYGHTKLASEKVLLGMANDDFRPSIVRFATIYGLSGRTRFDLVVNLLTAKAKMDGQITVFGGDQWRPFVHVDDAALAVAKVLDAPLDVVGSQIYNVGSDEQNYTITDIGKMVHEQVLAAELLINSDDTDKRNYRVSFAKIRKQLGFEPQWTVAMGIQQVLEAISNGDVENYTEARYSNVKFLKEQEQLGEGADQRNFRGAGADVGLIFSLKCSAEEFSVFSFQFSVLGLGAHVESCTRSECRFQKNRCTQILKTEHFKLLASEHFKLPNVFHDRKTRPRPCDLLADLAAERAVVGNRGVAGALGFAGIDPVLAGSAGTERKHLSGVQVSHDDRLAACAGQRDLRS